MQLSPVGIRSPAAKHGADAILLDMFLSDSQGTATFDRVFAVAAHTPILILTTSEQEASAKLAVARGAHDYVLKNRLDAYLLPRVLRGMMDRAANTEALFQEKERAQVTLNSIGDAVISTDLKGRITFLNVVAERLTGWPREEAMDRPLEEVLQIVDAVTREAVRNPMRLAISANKTVGLTPNCVLVRRDGIEAAIEDSAAPIHDRHGQVTGAVMVFHDVSSARALSLKMSYLAQHDSLTDLPNRVLLNDRLEQADVDSPAREPEAWSSVPGYRPLQDHQRFTGTCHRRSPVAIRGVCACSTAFATPTPSAVRAGTNS